MKAMMAILTTVLLMNLFSVLAHARAISAAKAPICILASEGLAINAWVKHRILIANEAVFGADDMESVATKLHTFRQQGLCQ